MTAFAAASCAAFRLLNKSPSRQVNPQGRLLHNFALVRFRVCTTELCCEVDKVARNAFARQTTFSTPVALEQSVAVALTVTVKLQDCPPKLMAKLAVPDEVGVPVMLYVSVPEVLRVPAARVAVRPVTPVELMPLPAEYATEFPPV